MGKLWIEIKDNKFGLGKEFIKEIKLIVGQLRYGSMNYSELAGNNFVDSGWLDVLDRSTRNGGEED